MKILNKKKVVLILLAINCLFLFVGCNNDSRNNSGYRPEKVLCDKKNKSIYQGKYLITDVKFETIETSSSYLSSIVICSFIDSHSKELRFFAFFYDSDIYNIYTSDDESNYMEVTTDTIDIYLNKEKYMEILH